jgi:hypothetical protein
MKKQISYAVSLSVGHPKAHEAKDNHHSRVGMMSDAQTVVFSWYA